MNPKISHPPVKMAAVDAHVLGGLADIAVKFRELVQDKFPLVSVGRFLE